MMRTLDSTEFLGGADPDWLRIALIAVAALLATAGVTLVIAGSPIPGILLVACVFAAGWLVLSIRRPDTAFAATLFVWVLAYARLSLQVLSLAGPSTSNRGSLAIADLMWLGLLAGLMLRRSTWRTGLQALDTPQLWATLPYGAAAVGLPILGVLAGGWPAGFATPSMRFLQWASFLPLGFVIARQTGAHRLFRTCFIMLVTAGALHAAYALLQLTVQLGGLGQGWLVLDELHSRYNDVTWFFFARVTGLLVNPNHYGLLGVFVLVAGVSWLIGGSRRARGLGWLAIAAAIVPILLTGSRSALVAAVAVTGFWAALAMAGNAAAVRMVRMLPILLAGVALVTAAVWRFLPSSLQNRYHRLIAVFVEGTGAEQNLTLRMEMWSEAWRAFMSQYPAGTWVPPSYALGMPIDSYFVFTAVQGTPLLTLLWLVMMGGLFMLGLSAYQRRGSEALTAAGLILCGWIVTLVVSSLTMSPLLQIQLSVPMWSMAGIIVALRQEAGAA